MPEFLVKFSINLPNGLYEEDREKIYAQEAAAAKPFLDNGTFARVWRVPGTRDHIALWNAPDADYVHRAYETFPLFLFNWGRVTEFVALAVNPNDPGYPAQDRPDLPMTWHDLNRVYEAEEGTTPGEGSAQWAHKEGKTVMLTDTVSIHKHPGSGEPDEFHFMVGDVKVAEIGPDKNEHGELKGPGYVDFLAEWAGAPVGYRKWKARIAADNKVLHPDYAAALAAPRARF
jgi:muconolactone delta-isomerase